MVLLYAVDRARKLRARARQMSAMNERLDVAAAKVDEQQERKQARVRASAELTSVLPAIKRPPLTLPGVPGPAAGPAEEPAAPEPEAGPAAPAAARRPRTTPDGAGGGEPGRPGRGGRCGQPGRRGQAPAAGDGPAGDSRPETAAEVPPEPVRTPEGTLTMGRVIPDATAAPKLQVTSDGTMIMPPVPGQGPAPAGEASACPCGPGPDQPGPGRPAPDAQPRASQPGRPAPGSPASPVLSQPRTKQQSTSQEQANRD